MKRGVYLITTLALVGCGGGKGNVELGEEGKLMGYMTEVVDIFSSVTPYFRWTDLHDRIAYDFKRGKSPKDIAIELLDKETDLNRLLNERIYLPIALSLSGTTSSSRDMEIVLISCSWFINEEIKRKVDSLLEANKYEAIEYMQKGLVKYITHILSSGDSLAPLKVEKAVMAYSCFHAMAEAFSEKGSLVPSIINSIIMGAYWTILKEHPDVAQRIREVGHIEEKK